MQVFKEKGLLKEALNKVVSEGKTIGLVPTMGALHHGHLSLVENAVMTCDQVVVSIFVNPTQFDNPSDLEQYPRGLEKDLQLLMEVRQDLWIFAPTAQELYDGKVVPQHFEFGGLEKIMEGKFRKGHFDGVGTVIKLLFETITPDKAFFGEKDFQQLQIIRKLTEELGLPVRIMGCPILREENGLAQSSRNERLSPLLRERAAFIYQTLLKARALFGTKSASYITRWVDRQFKECPCLTLEYFEIAETSTLQPIVRKRKGQHYRAFIAVYADQVRLIDNLALNS